MADPALAFEAHRDLAPPIERALGFFTTPLQNEEADMAHGYLDLLGGEDPTGPIPASG